MLKESDLIKEHRYVSKSPKVKYGFVTERRIFEVNFTEGYVVYCEVKRVKDGLKATVKTVSTLSFLRWAGKDITKKGKK